MLKPKHVHGLNAEEGSKSVLHRIHVAGNDASAKISDFPIDPFDDPADKPVWAWTLG